MTNRVFRFVGTCLLLTTLCNISGCTLFPPKHHDFCASYRPILISHSDQLTDETARQILAANKTWKEFCQCSRNSLRRWAWLVFAR